MIDFEEVVVFRIGLFIICKYNLMYVYLFIFCYYRIVFRLFVE